MKETSIFLEHMLEAILDTESFLAGVKKDFFLSNKEKQNAVVRSLEIIGEAAKNVPESFKSKSADIPWKEIAGTRDKIIHHYFGLDLDIIWDIATKDLPELKKAIQEIKKRKT